MALYAKSCGFDFALVATSHENPPRASTTLPRSPKEPASTLPERVHVEVSAVRLVVNRQVVSSRELMRRAVVRTKGCSHRAKRKMRASRLVVVAKSGGGVEGPISRYAEVCRVDIG